MKITFRHILFAFIIVGLIVRLYQHQGALFNDWDEGIYAKVAEDIANRNAFVFPRFNGTPYLDKPPVTHGVAAIGFKLAPSHKELASRGMMTLVAVAMLIFIYILSRRITTTFFSNQLGTLQEWQKELLFFTPVFATALTPVFLDRAIRLNTDSILTLSWLGYFLAGTSFRGKFISVVVGTWTKSIAGFYPMIFDIFSFAYAKNKIRQLTMYAGIILVALGWLFANYVKYGEAFVQSHVQDQLFKRIYVPIELHFGGRLFYPEFLLKELSFVLPIIVVAYMLIAWDILGKLKKGSQLFSTKEWTQYLVLISPLPFFIVLTYAKSKLWWYMIMMIPFFALTIPYLLMRIKNTSVRSMVLFAICLFFLYRFLPQTYLLKPVIDIPEKLRVAQCVAQIPSERVLIMVNDQERRNRNVVEAAQLQTASSFVYGGSPAFIYYAQKPVVHYYKLEELVERLQAQGAYSDILVISKDDMGSPEFSAVKDILQEAKRESTCYFGEWEVYNLSSND